jgi:hypothetical protein
MSVTVKIENTYEDGHESVVNVIVADPEDDDLEMWWEDEVFPHTGDGHGEKYPKLGSMYEATITKADDASLVGQSMEWG